MKNKIFDVLVLVVEAFSAFYLPQRFRGFEGVFR
jgi:hypothetical protein